MTIIWHYRGTLTRRSLKFPTARLPVVAAEQSRGKVLLAIRRAFPSHSRDFKGGPSKFPALLFWERVEGQFQKCDILRLPDAFQKTVWATLDGYMANTNST